MGYSHIYMIVEIFAAAGVIALASLIGVISMQSFLKDFFTKNARYLVSFATGVFLILIYSLITEIFEVSNILYPLLAVAGGFLFFTGLTTLLSKAHHHHGKTEHHNHNKIDARRMLLGDALHNMGDGLLLVPIFMANSTLGFAAVLGMLLHEMVQEIAEFFILKEAGLSTPMALFLNFLTSLTIFIGVGIGLFVSNIEGVALLLLAFTTGGFINIVLRDFIPSIFRSVKYECAPLPHLFFFIAGFVLMLLVKGL